MSSAQPESRLARVRRWHVPGPRSANWILAPLVVWLAARVIDTVLVLGAYQHFDPAVWSGFRREDASSDGYLEAATLWDGQWYWLIAENGYPHDLPRSDGEVQPNALAFYPLFPLVARAISTLGTWGFPVSGVLVSLVCGAAATCVVYRMADVRRGRWFAVTAAVVLNFFPVSPVLQMAYTEAMALLWLVLALWFLDRHRHLAALACCVLLALTRPIALPLAAVIAWHLHRCDGGLRGRRPTPARRWSVSLGAVLSFGLWPAFVSVRTGEADAYLLTQRAWVNVVPGSAAESWLSLAIRGPLPVVVLLVGVAVLLYALVVRRSRMTWGPDAQAWAASYLLFLAVATHPISSIFRFGLMLGPTLWSLDESGHRPSGWRARTGLIATVALLGVVSQYLWLRWFFIPSEFHVSFP